MPNLCGEKRALPDISLNAGMSQAFYYGVRGGWPGNMFLYGPGTAPGASYLYVLDSQGLGSGAHELSFKVQGDPIAHKALFTLKK